ncbi:MAG: lycopene beta-cyclase CrtY [Novosphingobium sp.]
MQSRPIDIAILGGGLSGGLLALALARLRPGLRVVVVEMDRQLGGNHVWSWFRRDVSHQDEWLVAPLTVRHWPGYDVRFPAHSRRLSSGYSSATGERLDEVVRERLPVEDVITGAAVVEAGPAHVTLADGTRLEANAVIDARGAHGLPHMAGGWQKFLGQMLRLEAPHGLGRPIVMDARVEQHDGYRFVYCLPFSDTEVFVEDTYYADGPELDLPVLRDRIDAYALAQGWRVAEVSREETGVLPVIASGDFDAFWQSGEQGIARAGTRAALVHPLTGYSLPDAVRLAMRVARLRDVSGGALAGAMHDHARSVWKERSFYRMLATMLFSAARPEERYRVLERFYTLPEGLIERFYAAKSTRLDMVRLLAGKPPVPVSAAIASLAGRGRPLSSLGPKS